MKLLFVLILLVVLIAGKFIIKASRFSDFFSVCAEASTAHAHGSHVKKNQHKSSKSRVKNTMEVAVVFGKNAVEHQLIPRLLQTNILMTVATTMMTMTMEKDITATF
ncbi:hypothetical protein M3Y94_00625800 [Aphelenchoides besseyi]|nr:hypothetical protein M3Y94_00625800 [Aphelenchoides besseyi]